MAKRRTRAPLATTVPAPSTPGIRGNFGRPELRHEPSRIDVSQLPIPAVWIAMRTSCGRGCGTGNSCSFSTEGGPKRSTAAAFIVAGMMEVRMLVNAMATGGFRCSSCRKRPPWSHSRPFRLDWPCAIAHDAPGEAGLVRHSELSYVRAVQQTAVRGEIDVDKERFTVGGSAAERGAAVRRRGGIGRAGAETAARVRRV